MSSCWVSLWLLVLLGVELASGRPCQFVSENLKQTHESIADVLKLKEQEIGSHPLFGAVIKNINTSCQRKVHLMNATLDIYTRIFSSILQQGQQHGRSGSALLDQLSTPEKREVKSFVTKLQQKIEELRKHLNHLNHEKEDVLNKLNRIEVDDPLVQRKALAQFNEVYQAASVIGFPLCGQSTPAE